MGWKLGINPSYFFLFGETWDHIFFIWEAYLGSLLGNFSWNLLSLWRALNSPLPSFIKERDVLLSDWEYVHGLECYFHSFKNGMFCCRTGNISKGWISLHYFYPVMLLPNFRLLKNGMFSRGYIMYCANPWDMDIWIFLLHNHVTILQGEYDLLS